MFDKFSLNREKLVWLILAFLTLAAGLGLFWAFDQEAENLVKVSFFDVGQGSSILVSAPNGNQVLIDGGPSDAVLAKLGEAMPVNDRQIELVILTHPDSDHLSGLIEVLKRYEVEKILETGIVDDTAEYSAWNDLVADKKIPLVFAGQGQIIKIADHLAIQILYPLNKIIGQDFSGRTNDSSIVGKLYYGKNTMLFTGDAEKTAELALVSQRINLKADILVVGHHGSKTSTSQDFLAAVLPEVAVIQVGADNRYGHPSPEVLERLGKIKLFRNDLDGDIRFACDFEKCQKTK